MDIVSFVLQNLLALVGLVIAGAGAVTAAALPLIAWVQASRAVLWPVLQKLQPLRRKTQFGLLDVGCLLTELSLVGLVTAPIGYGAINRRLALLWLLLATAAAVTGWRLAVRWLTYSHIVSLPRRIVFQLLVVPTALCFPILFAALAYELAWLLSCPGSLGQIAFVVALLAAALATALVLRASHFLAGWVVSASDS
jgi:hypothetical protein